MTLPMIMVAESVWAGGKMIGYVHPAMATIERTMLSYDVYKFRHIRLRDRTSAT